MKNLTQIISKKSNNNPLLYLIDYRKFGFILFLATSVEFHYIVHFAIIAITFILIN